MKRLAAPDGEPSRRDSVHRLHNECTVQWVAQCRRTGEAMWCHGVGRVPGVPDQVQIVADHRNPMEAQIEIDALVLVVELDESLEGGARVERVLDPAACLDRVEAVPRQPYGAARYLGSSGEMPSMEPGCSERRV